jgi:hypothetical protein
MGSSPSSEWTEKEGGLTRRWGNYALLATDPTDKRVFWAWPALHKTEAAYLEAVAEGTAALRQLYQSRKIYPIVSDTIVLHFRCSDGPFNHHPDYPLVRGEYLDFAMAVAQSRHPDVATIHVESCSHHERPSSDLREHAACNRFTQDVVDYLRSGWPEYTIDIRCRPEHEAVRRMLGARMLIMTTPSTFYFVTGVQKGLDFVTPRTLGVVPKWSSPNLPQRVPWTMYDGPLLTDTLYPVSRVGNYANLDYANFLRDGSIKMIPPVKVQARGAVVAPGTHHNNNRAVIIEPREHPALETVINNVGAKTGWPVTLVHGTANAAFARRIADTSPHVDILAEVNADNLDYEAYNYLSRHPTYWNNIGAVDGGTLLRFETDSGICGTGIDDFVGYDYCGALWPKWYTQFDEATVQGAAGLLGSCFACVIASIVLFRCRSKAPRAFTVAGPLFMALSVTLTVCTGIWVGRRGRPWYGSVGNGGFSIRSTDFMKRASTRSRLSGADDTYFSDACKRDADCRICPPDVARRFSEERVRSPDAFGFHKNWKNWQYGSPGNCDVNTRVHALQTNTFDNSVVSGPPKEWEPNVRIVWRRGS